MARHLQPPTACHQAHSDQRTQVIIMDANLQRRVQRYGWDKASLHYEKFWQDQLRPAQEWLLETARIQPGETIIDIACGTGLITFPLAVATGESGLVLGTDISA